MLDLLRLSAATKPIWLIALEIAVRACKSVDAYGLIEQSIIWRVLRHSP